MEQRKIDVEDLKSLLLRRRITRPRFRWPLSKEQAVKLLTAAYDAEVEFRHRTLKLDDNTKKNIDVVANFLTNENSKFGLMLCGMCGNGKTTMLYALQKACNYLSSGHYFDGMFGQYENIGLSVMDARELTQIRSKDYKQFSTIRQRFMLAIDDLGTEPTEVLDYGNVLSPVVELLEHRYDSQLFTVITTNVAPKDIKEKYGQRIADRFNEMMQVVVFENPTYRK